MTVDGKDRRALTDDKTAYLRSAAWTPDGNYLVARKQDAKPAGIPPVELWMYHRLGGTGIKLTSSDEWHHASGPGAVQVLSVSESNCAGFISNPSWRSSGVYSAARVEESQAAS